MQCYGTGTKIKKNHTNFVKPKDVQRRNGSASSCRYRPRCRRNHTRNKKHPKCVHLRVVSKRCEETVEQTIDDQDRFQFGRRLQYGTNVTQAVFSEHEAQSDETKRRLNSECWLYNCVVFIKNKQQ